LSSFLLPPASYDKGDSEEEDWDFPLPPHISPPSWLPVSYCPVSLCFAVFSRNGACGEIKPWCRLSSPCSLLFCRFTAFPLKIRHLLLVSPFRKLWISLLLLVVLSPNHFSPFGVRWLHLTRPSLPRGRPASNPVISPASNQVDFFDTRPSFQINFSRGPFLTGLLRCVELVLPPSPLDINPPMKFGFS